MNPISFVYLPYWVEAVLSRNNQTLSVCLDYSKVRKFLSLEDMSGLLAFQELKVIARDESDPSRTLLNSWMSSAEGAQLDELISSVVPLSRSNELKKELVSRLPSQQLPEGKSESDKLCFKVVDGSRECSFMVIYPGFVEFMAKPMNELQVVVSQLKVFYVYLKNHQVSQMPVFLSYLSLLLKTTSAKV